MASAIAGEVRLLTRRSLAQLVDNLWVAVCLFSTSEFEFPRSTRALTGSSEVIPEVQ
jgi:hypothetical protein